MQRIPAAHTTPVAHTWNSTYLETSSNPPTLQNIIMWHVWFCSANHCTWSDACDFLNPTLQKNIETQDILHSPNLHTKPNIKANLERARGQLGLLGPVRRQLGTHLPQLGADMSPNRTNFQLKELLAQNQTSQRNSFDPKPYFASNFLWSKAKPHKPSVQFRHLSQNLGCQKGSQTSC